MKHQKTMLYVVFDKSKIDFKLTKHNIQQYLVLHLSRYLVYYLQ